MSEPPMVAQEARSRQTRYLGMGLGVETLSRCRTAFLDPPPNRFSASPVGSIWLTGSPQDQAIWRNRAWEPDTRRELYPSRMRAVYTA